MIKILPPKDGYQIAELDVYNSHISVAAVAIHFNRNRRIRM